MKNNKWIKATLSIALLGFAITAITVYANASKKDEKPKMAEFNEFKSLVPSIAKMEDTPLFHLGDKVSQEELTRKNFILDKTQGHIQFYKYTESNPKFMDVPVSLIAAILDDGRVNGLVVQFKGEENKNKLQEAMTAKFGTPASEGQENTVMKVFWGESLPSNIKKEGKIKDIRPISLTFDFYVQDGFLFWENPNQLFKEKK